MVLAGGGAGVDGAGAAVGAGDAVGAGEAVGGADGEGEAAADELGASLLGAILLGAVLGRSAGNGATGLRTAATLAWLGGSCATRSSTAQLPSKRTHSTDDRTLRIAQTRRGATARFVFS